MPDRNGADAPAAAVVTPPGRGAVATVRVVHAADRADPLFAAANGRPASAQPVGRVAFGRWVSGEEVVLVRTGPAVTEAHVHGGAAATARVLADLADAGVEPVDGFELVRRTGGTLAAESAAALAAAPTARCAAVLLDQAAGTLERGLAEAAGDRDAAAAVLRRAAFGRHLTRPWRVVLFGPPNVGKSSLLNAAAGFARAIVSPTPGTTRDAVTVEAALDGWPVRLTDTAGLRRTADPLEAAGVRRTRLALAGADLTVRVADATGPPPPDDRGDLLVANKSDLLPGGTGADWADLRVSAATGTGVSELCARIAARLVPDPPAPGTPVPFTERQIAWLGECGSVSQVP